MQPLFLAGLAVLCIASGQILFKITADRIAGQSLPAILADWRTLMIFGSALGIYAFATVIWILALRDLTLSHAYMIMSFSFVLVPIAAALFFGETLSFRFFAGLALIIAGVILTLGARP